MAVLIDRLSGGRVHADAVTLVGLAGHVPVALLIATGHHLWASVVFLFAMVTDAIDGELARIQQRASVRGMLLDATVDRIEEVAMYCGIAYYVARHDSASAVVWVVAACGAALCVSYVKAKGESAVASQLAEAGSGLSHDALNRRFQVGVAGLKIRRYISLIGIATGFFVPMALLLTALSAITFTQRWIAIARSLATPPSTAEDGDALQTNRQ